LLLFDGAETNNKEAVLETHFNGIFDFCAAASPDSSRGSHFARRYHQGQADGPLKSASVALRLNSSRDGGHKQLDINSRNIDDSISIAVLRFHFSDVGFSIAFEN
jgi:hypothetical protein